jgi:hypothetical protein
VVIAEMPRPLHTVLVLVALGGLEVDEVATQLKIKYGNARTRLCRARDYLRERFGTLDDHLAFLAPVPVIDEAKPQSLPRRALVLSGQFVHLWPPILMGLLAFSQMDMPTPYETSIVAIIRNEVERPQSVTKVVDVFRAKSSTSSAHADVPGTANALPQHRSLAKSKVGVASSRGTFQESIAPSDALIGDGL